MTVTVGDAPHEPAGPLPYGPDWTILPSVFARVAGMPMDWILAEPGADHAGARAAGEQALAEIVRQPLFAEALTWQNRGMFRQARRNLDSARPQRRREAQRRLWAYAARYCAKNDTIGFFGPIVWGSVTTGATDIGPVTDRLLRRGVFFEHWALRAVATAIETRHGLDPWTIPRLAAGVAVVADGVLLADNAPLRLDALPRRVVEVCDGTRTVVDVVDELADHPAPEVGAVLTRLRAMGVLTAGLVVPRRVDPEAHLRGQLARVADSRRRVAAQADLAELVAARDRVADAAGDADRLTEALEGLDDTFVAITGREARRGTGQFYAGRGVVYEDCLGDLPVRLGADVLDPIRPALELLLFSAAWFTRAVAQAYERFIADLITAQEPAPGAGVPLSEILTAVAGTTAWGARSPADAVAERLRRTWHALLVGDADPGRRRIGHDATALRSGVESAFAHDVVGWRGTRLYSPDLMIAARSAADLRDGRFLAVLGELHPAHNTMDVLAADAWHPDRDRWHGWLDSSAPTDRVTPLYPLDHDQINSRTVPPSAYLSPSATYLGLGSGVPYHPRGARMLPVSALRATRVGDRVVITSAVDPEYAADVPTVFGELLANAAATRFGILPAADHRPRLCIGDLVVQRESWTLPYPELPSPNQGPDRACDVLRAIGAARDMPRHVFVTVGGERKPFHLDFGNPLSVEVLLSHLRRQQRAEPTGRVTFVEMLPDPDQLWLTDAAGRRYTAEFRITCVDQRTAGNGHSSSPGAQP
ncbi:lantibiotic dehydratase family protein [Micromonospora peucetia]|uniref:lantibiotic dehydratase n=1 Tax=Micromonospora peucetia TaxID=47871 RepID=UPI00225A4CCD|nr:lantibiotic dehydratase [Micromonospora peucetia]MCX4386331.1 lantibiotic dehydratase family protein [Micromonospora peucetia]